MFYVSKIVVPSRVCACKDAMKGTKKEMKKWLNGQWSIGGNIPLSIRDLENEKYFEKCQS